MPALPPDKRALVDQGYQEIGASLAEAIVLAGKDYDWAWSLIGPTGLYGYWMLDYWVLRYRQINRENISKYKKRNRRLGRPWRYNCFFQSTEEIKEALRSMTLGLDPLECVKKKRISENG